jgi:uncharacterized protein
MALCRRSLSAEPLWEARHCAMECGVWLDILLFCAAFLAGVVNSMAGGGTLLTFPALLSAGLPAVTANATSTVALVPGSLSAFWGYRSEVQGEGRLLAAMAVPSLMGGTLGALAADRVGDAVFAKLAPLLVLGATCLFMAQEPLRRWARSASGSRGEGGREVRELGPIAGFQLLVALYGGFFGAGIGILMLASLGLLGLRDIHRMNGLKNIAAVCINGLAALTFAACGRVNWPIASFMIVGGIAGGYTGAGLARRLGQQMVRRFIVLIGLLISLYLFLRLALHP